MPHHPRKPGATTRERPCNATSPPQTWRYHARIAMQCHIALGQLAEFGLAEIALAEIALAQPARGSTTRKVAPSPSLVATAAVPPWAATRLATIDKPSPLPFVDAARSASRAREWSAR